MPHFIHPIIMLLKIMALLPHKAQQRLGRKLGKVLPKILKKRYLISKVNIDLTKQPDGTLDKHWESLGISLFETANALFARSDRLNPRLIINNPEIVQSLMDNGENIMLLVPHTTHMLLAGRCLLTKFPTFNIYRPQNNKAFNHYMTKAYTDNGSTLIKSDNPRGIIKALKSGTPVWYAPDVSQSGKNTFASFYGIPTLTLTSTKKLSDISKAKIVPLSFIRTNGNYTLSFETPFSLADLSQEDAGCKVNNELEKLINKKPEQYYWVHRRFKATKNNKDVYK